MFSAGCKQSHIEEAKLVKSLFMPSKTFRGVTSVSDTKTVAGRVSELLAREFGEVMSILWDMAD
jgi:hypothetical protein